jgi:hypothetical protein
MEVLRADPAQVARRPLGQATIIVGHPHRAATDGHVVGRVEANLLAYPGASDLREEAAVALALDHPGEPHAVSDADLPALILTAHLHAGLRVGTPTARPQRNPRHLAVRVGDPRVLPRDRDCGGPRIHLHRDVAFPTSATAS